MLACDTELICCYGLYVFHLWEVSAGICCLLVIFFLRCGRVVTLCVFCMSVYVLYVRVPWIGDQHFLLAFGEEWHLEVVGVCELPT